MSNKKLVLNIQQHNDVHTNSKTKSQNNFSKTAIGRSSIMAVDSDKNSLTQEMVFNIPKGKHG